MSAELKQDAAAQDVPPGFGEALLELQQGRAEEAKRLLADTVQRRSTEGVALSRRRDRCKTLDGRRARITHAPSPAVRWERAGVRANLLSHQFLALTLTLSHCHATGEGT
jgi:hypothetical protein